MTRPAVIVHKSGGPLYAREYAKASSPSGEQGETEGLLRYLSSHTEFRTIYFGQAYGQLPCDYVAPCLDGLHDLSSAEQQEENWQVDVDSMLAVLGSSEPVVMLNVAGYSSTWGWIGNPNGAQLQACGIRHNGPGLNIIEQFKLPRVVINNDPRTYPKEQEMSYGWDHIKPVALLDQCNAEVSQIVGGKKYLRRSVWARPESWAYHLRRKNTEKVPCVCIAHAHIADGCKGRGRDISWQRILGDCTGYCTNLPEDMKVYGSGWEYFSGYDPELMPGKIKPSEVMLFLNRSISCPCVAVAPEFYTGKVYVCEAQGCIPLLYGDGADPYTWDPYERFLPLGSAWRINKPGDLKRIVRMLCENESLRVEMREWFADRCKPDYQVLDRLLGDVLSKQPRDGVWWQRYGGYCLV
jgi:hypothetical protein